jgi:hypothetical protein
VKLFNVIAINERTKTKTVLTNSPLNHGEAVTMKDKFTPHKQLVRSLLSTTSALSSAGTVERTHPNEPTTCPSI